MPQGNLSLFTRRLNNYISDAKYDLYEFSVITNILYFSDRNDFTLMSEQSFFNNQLLIGQCVPACTPISRSYNNYQK